MCSQASAFDPAQLLPREAWRPFPPASERAAWNEALAKPLNRSRVDAILKRGAEAMAVPPVAIPATAYMVFKREGVRKVYDGLSHSKTDQLGALVLAECCEGKGRFLDAVIDAVWSMCELSTWSVPAHEDRRMLTDITQPVVELRSTHVAWVLAETLWLLGEAFDAVSPRIRERILLETQRRVLTPYLEREDWWWLGFNHVREVNNWTAVCNAGVVAAAMYLEDDADRLARIVTRSLRSMEHFLACYGEDGGCDEGPGYWNYGVGRMVMLAEMYHSRTGGAVDLYADPRVRAMAEFPHRVRLTDGYFVNFADCGPRAAFQRPVIRRYAERVGSEGLLGLAAASNASGALPIITGVRGLFWDADPLPEATSSMERTVWFPDLQWMVARQGKADDGGLVLAAKAGHNAEKHNHNDGGAFIICHSGRPVIIDIGAEEYRAQTFSSRRYEALPMRSLGHNVPLVGDVEQCNGAEFAASDVAFEEQDGRALLRQDLRGFYPPEAGIRSWVRAIELERAEGGCVRVTDAFELDSARDVAVPLYTPEPCEVLGDRAARIGGLVLVADGDVRLVVESVPMTDARLRNTWGDALSRVWVRSSETSAKGRFALCFQPAE